jgi:hypothetical protein
MCLYSIVELRATLKNKVDFLSESFGRSVTAAAHLARVRGRAGGSWVLQPIEDMASLRTDFDTYANLQGYIEGPTAKDFVARKTNTIALSKARGTHWNVIMCKEHLENCPEAVI